MKRGQTGSFVIFCNSRYLALKLTQCLEKKLNEKFVANCDVLVVHGHQFLSDKIYQTRIYCDVDAEDDELEGMSFRCLVGTNAINVGIDKHSVWEQKRCKFPRDLPTFFQERLRGLRERGKASICTVFLDMSSMQYLQKQLLQSHIDDESEMTANSELIGFNSMITSLKQRPSQTTKHLR